MRGFLRTAGLIVLVCAVAGAAVANDYFPQSVASGDPTSDSVVLVDAGSDADGEIPTRVDLAVATDEAMTNIVVTRSIDVDAEYDGVVKVKVDGLMPYTTYYYQFSFGGNTLTDRSHSHCAQLRDPTSRCAFAVVYCQDYIGRYYNAYLKMLLDHDEDIDFIVHLGDYIYETTGDPQFQDPSSERKIEFEDTRAPSSSVPRRIPTTRRPACPTTVTSTGPTRSDPVLQQVHERWPMMVIWDDHEYSNDCWGATATYSNGRRTSTTSSASRTPSGPSSSGCRSMPASTRTASSTSAPTISTRTA